MYLLVGEAAGKAPFGIAKKEDVNANINQMRGKVDSTTGVVNETRMVNSMKKCFPFRSFFFIDRN